MPAAAGAPRYENTAYRLGVVDIERTHLRAPPWVPPRIGVRGDEVGGKSGWCALTRALTPTLSRRRGGIKSVSVSRPRPTVGTGFPRYDGVGGRPIFVPFPLNCQNPGFVARRCFPTVSPTGPCRAISR